MTTTLMAPYHFLTSRYGQVAAAAAGVMLGQLMLLGVELGSQLRQKYEDAGRQTYSYF
ncbi:MAG: hypothetical protein R3E66_03500 [bacterium]